MRQTGGNQARDPHKRTTLKLLLLAAGGAVLSACTDKSADKPNTSGQGGGTGNGTEIIGGGAAPLELRPVYSQVIGNAQRTSSAAKVLGINPDKMSALPRAQLATDPARPQANTCYESAGNNKYVTSWFTEGVGSPGLFVAIQKDPGGTTAQQLASIYDSSKKLGLMNRLWQENGSTGYQNTASGLTTIVGRDTLISVWAGNLSYTTNGYSLEPAGDQAALTGPTFKNLAAFAKTLI